MTDELLVREALAEAERPRQRSKQRMVRWSDLDRELAQRALTGIETGEEKR